MAEKSPSRGGDEAEAEADDDFFYDPIGRGAPYVSIPRGGPIYIPDMVGPLTTVYDFESSVTHLLQDLKSVLSGDSLENFDDEISVDELKIITEEELVNIALEEAFRDELPRSSSQVSEKHPDTNCKREDGSTTSVTEPAILNGSSEGNNDVAPHDSPSESSIICHDNGELSKKISRKGKRKQQDDFRKAGNARKGKRERQVDSRTVGSELYSGSSMNEGNALVPHDSSNCSALMVIDDRRLSTSTSNKRKVGRYTRKTGTLEESVLTKVEQLARIKQKQDEDRAAARLHSFDCGINRCLIVPSDKKERITSLKSCSTKVKSSIAHEHIPVLYPEIVLSVEVYHNRRTFVKTQEFLVLGNQFLTELRDKIYCLMDQVMEKAGQFDSSGYFLVEDVFCNDMRDPSAMDYSKPILDWIRYSKDEALQKWECILSGELQNKQKEVLGTQTDLQLPWFKAVDMHKTRFCDLRFRLGAGYLYCHQGDCKHLIVIRDMRLIHPEDVQNRAAYPLIPFQVKLRVRKCSVCKILKAEKVTVDDKWAPHNPCYFCGICYYMLHYVNGSLLYNDFLVYDYFHEHLS